MAGVNSYSAVGKSFLVPSWVGSITNMRGNTWQPKDEL